MHCPFCANHCNRTIVHFADGTHYVQGNRCERGEIVGDPNDREIKQRAMAATRRIMSVPNLIEERERNIGVGIEFEMQFGDWPGRPHQVKK